MIRTVLALFSIAVLICGVIIYRPFSDTPAAHSAPTDVEVTRAAGQGTDTLALAAVASAPAPRPAPVAAQPATPPRPDTSDTDLTAMTNNVLAELGFAGVSPTPTAADADRASTADILANISAATGQESVLDDRPTLESIVVAALRAGESDGEIDRIVNEAAASGDLAVPELLVTSDGRVDTHVMLANIVTQAQIAAGGAAPAAPRVTPDNTQGMEVRVVQRATDEVQARFYTVQPGDSLGAISIKFFGVVSYYDAIFDANRSKLASPDRIRVGQRLVIPQI
ncbi:LysM peptidoglycan-binding domain-containing protein [Thalassorhabdomicrobium marinisediminis]|uniref:LysM domain-containing protein n=1 Tax=Thalassorhabdomicrobium marinisediminis TaxID=2170577 RepID=A0A2T7FVV3_9RHOB|nr:LysM peptidoglycan-binding domain-containing protein [Thalassorhabdomicrobium marinisediminis]PVA06295.1 hypothetical protein DC363_10325 [Thalassorhabdomicrobium marinisediminis]